MGGLKDFFLGKKEADTPSGYIPLPEDIQRIVDLARDYAKRSAEQTESAFMDPRSLSELQTATQVRGIQQGAEDSRSRLNDMLARRGMQNSGAAFTAMRNAGRDEAEQTSQLRAQMPLIEQQQRLKKAEALGNNAQMIANTAGPVPTYVQGQKGGRKGGMLPLAAGLAGTLIGGPAVGSMAAGGSTLLSQAFGGNTDYSPQAAQNQLQSGFSSYYGGDNEQQKANIYRQMLAELLANKSAGSSAGKYSY